MSVNYVEQFITIILEENGLKVYNFISFMNEEFQNIALKRNCSQA